MEEITLLKKGKTHFTSQYSSQFTTLFYVYVYHFKNCKVEIREDSKGFYFILFFLFVCGEEGS